MAEKKIGISRDLIIHPGETIADILEERGISQLELAIKTDVSAAFISNVISGKKDISPNLAMALEYALGIPKSFWLNLQSIYEAELLEAGIEESITDDERNVRSQLSEVIKYLRSQNILSTNESKDASIISLRRWLKISNLCNLSKIQQAGAFRISEKSTANQYVLGAWVLMCQRFGENRTLDTEFDSQNMNSLIYELKTVMLNTPANLYEKLKEVFLNYGIDFYIVKHFKGAPVQGYISKKKDGSYQLCMTIRQAFADIFWFSLFHELGHIFNGDLQKNSGFLDDSSDTNKELAADKFASEQLIDSIKYAEFVNSFPDPTCITISAINSFASSQRVMPYVVIGRLQRENKIPYTRFSEFKRRYKWSNSN